MLNAELAEAVQLLEEQRSLRRKEKEREEGKVVVHFYNTNTAGAAAASTSASAALIYRPFKKGGQNKEFEGQLAAAAAPVKQYRRTPHTTRVSMTRFFLSLSIKVVIINNKHKAKWLVENGVGIFDIRVTR